MRFHIPIIVLILLIATSCGYQQIRFTKVVKTNSEKTHTTDSESSSQISQNDSYEIINKEEVIRPKVELIPSEELISILEVEHVKNTPTPTPTDTLESERDIPVDMEYLAKKAAKRASTASVLFISSSIFLFIFPFLSIPLTAIGVWFFVKSSRSRFITQEGEDELRRAKIFLIINLIVMFLIIALLAILFSAVF